MNFISGRKAVLTIFNDGKELEKITLSDYNDKEKLHQLFAEKGFTKYSGEELTERRKMKEIKEKQDAAENAAANAAAGVGNSQPSPKLRKREMKEKLHKLKRARENFMVVGQPRG